MARAYPVHEAKAKLSELLRRVKRGRTVTISEHGREIARVSPIQATPDLQSRLARLEREGVVVPAAGSVAGVRPLLRKRGALRRFLSARE
jgi:prevent-host-death family protein